MDYSMTGKIRERTGNRKPHFVPAEDFDTQDGNILVINAGVPADIIRNIADLAQDDHMRQGEAIMEFDDPEIGKILLPSIFPKITKSPGCVKFLGAKLGEYSQEIYGDFLGLEQDEIDELKNKGVIWTHSFTISTLIIRYSIIAFQKLVFLKL